MLRVNLRDGSRIVLGRPGTAGEALVGYPEGDRQVFPRGTPVGIPMEQIEYCEVRVASGEKTVLFVTGTVVFCVGLFAIDRAVDPLQ